MELLNPSLASTAPWPGHVLILGAVAVGCALGPIAAAIAGQIGRADALRGCAQAVAEEMTRLGCAAGLSLTEEPDACLHAIAQAGEHVTSMCQDFDARRTLEYEAICDVPLALAARPGMPMPVSEATFALTRHAAAIRPGANAEA